MTRQEILAAAQKCVCTDRNDQYGEPEDSFSAIANFWTDYVLASCTEGEANSFSGFNLADVAAMMALLKIARIAGDSSKADSWIDLAGYAACGGELATDNEEDQQ